jgi:cyanophycin synthetase
MQLVDARRLTGPNHLSRRPLVVVEFTLSESDDRAEARKAYASELGRIRVALGFSPEVELLERPHLGGTVFAYPEAIDVMLACAEMSEWAGLSACELALGKKALPLEPKLFEIKTLLDRDRSPKLLELKAEASRRDVPFLWDDAEVSLGLGARSLTWPRNALPDLSEVPWSTLGRIPVALVTGTNGKTTSSRLLAKVAREAGFRVGATSSDSITLDGVVVEEGDWTGPAAARVVLRRRDVTCAVLETARGGILRRGLALDSCDVALLTNVTDDHLGTYGIDDLDAMARVKAVIAYAASAHSAPGTVVINARDARLCALGSALREAGACVVWFSDLERASPSERRWLEEARASGDTVVFALDGVMVRATRDAAITLVRVDEVPITFAGSARFNVENALGVIAAATALGLDDAAIARGLRSFSLEENPRRTTLVERRGARILLDFAHNPDGLRASMELVSSLRPEGGRLTIITGSAGDRLDREVEEMVAALAKSRPDRVIVRELHDYLRGRAPGEVPELFRRAFLARGLAEEAFVLAESEAHAMELALADARPGDFVALLIHLDHEQVQATLAKLA